MNVFSRENEENRNANCVCIAEGRNEKRNENVSVEEISKSANGNIRKTNQSSPFRLLDERDLN